MMPRRAVTTAELGIVAAFSGGLVITFLSQLPGNAFDRLRRTDVFGLIPNWKFFAPVPAMEDHELFHRAQLQSGDYSTWTRTSPPAPRQLAHLVWFPGRRADKGIFDHASELVQLTIADGLEDVGVAPSYRLIQASAEAAVRRTHPDAPAYQFAIVRHAGFDDSVEPQVALLSPIHLVATDRHRDPSTSAVRQTQKTEVRKKVQR
ncbi:hypothetical protein [Arthrobacter flavus]|uniref:GyrI-like small molecule binding domain-containing protein n=1 Tax=Arthrobacter flavus TaxID=95172 RepID=A0ABW4Q4U3_9MICC